MLDLRSNQLSELPEEIGQLQNLQVLVLANNNLSKLPGQITHLQNLQRLDLSRNPLKDFPDEGFALPLAGPSGRGEGFSNLADSLHAYTNYPKAYRAAQRATEVEPGSVHAWRGLSFHALYVGHIDTAVAAARRALALDAEEAQQANIYLALGLLLQGAYAEAQAVIDQWKDRSFDGDEQPAWARFLEELEKLEAAGIHHADFARAKAYLKEHGE